MRTGTQAESVPRATRRLDSRRRCPDAPGVIKSVTIKNLRGIREGELSELTPLVVLVGPNSSGKSTVLDAVLIGATRQPGAVVGFTVARRTELRHGARWLLWRGEEDTVASVRIGVEGRDLPERVLRWSESRIPVEQRRRLVESGAEGSYSCLRVEVAGSPAEHAETVLGAVNDYEASEGITQEGLPHVWLTQPSCGTPLPDLYSRITERGLRTFVGDLVRQIVPGLDTLEVLTHHGDPRLHLTFSDRSIPVALAGDGIRGLVRVCLELANKPEGSVLLEEPEANQHPGAIRQSARAIVASVRRGVQVILSTHSLELIDALLAELEDDELPLLSLYRLKLADGVLSKSRLEGSSVLRSRGEIGDDLR